MKRYLFSSILSACLLFVGMSLRADQDANSLRADLDASDQQKFSLRVDLDVSALQQFMKVANAVVLDSLHLSATQEIGYDDNIDETARSHRSGSWFTKTRIDGDLTRSRDNTSVGLEMGLAYEHYFHKGKNDDTRDFSYHLYPVLNGTYKLGRNTLMVHMLSKYERQELDRSQRTNTMVAINGIYLGWSTQLTGKAVLAATADYKNTHYSKNTYSGYNKQVYGINFTPYWNYSARTLLGLNAGIHRTSYNHPGRNHDNMNRYNFGTYTNYILNSRTAVFAEVGAEKTSYSKHSISNANYNKDYDMYFKGGVMYTASEDVALKLQIEKSKEDSWCSGSRGGRVEYSANASAIWQMTGKLTMTNNLGFVYADEKTSNGDIKEYTYGLLFTYRLRQNMILMAAWKLRIADYSNRDSYNYVDNEYRLGLTWYIK